MLGQPAIMNFSNSCCGRSALSIALTPFMVEINWRKYQSSNKNAVVASAMKLAFLFAMPFLITRRVFTNIDPELGISIYIVTISLYF